MQSKLLEKERQCRDLELQVHSSLRDVTASSGDLEALRKRLALSEAACKAGRSKEAQLNEVTAGSYSQGHSSSCSSPAFIDHCLCSYKNDFIFYVHSVL